LLYVCWLFALLVSVGIGPAFGAEGMEKQIELDIPAGTSLEDALLQWGDRTGMQVMMSTNVVRNEKVQAIQGTTRAATALSTLLRSAGLSYTVDGNTVRVVPATTLAPSGTRLRLSDSSNAVSDSGTEAQIPSEDNVQTMEGNAKVAQLSTTSNQNSRLGKGMEEVVVSAQKREERLQDVPVAVTALSAKALSDNNLVKLVDYYSAVPGLSVAPNAESAQNIAIRGITTGGFSTPTVGITIDDVPFGSSSGLVGNLVPDIDPGDLARVEVLRGPQGTLYGASSLGGLLKFVTIDPSTDRISGHVDAGTNSVYNGNGLGYNFRAGINIPLSDTFAVRASAFTRQDPGYIDNPVLGTEGINEAHARGGRLSALWKQSGTFSLKLSAMYQDITGNGTSGSSPLGNLQRIDVTALGIGGGEYDRRVQAYSAILKAKIGSADLIALSGYNVNASHNSIDATPNFGALTQLFFGLTATPEFIDNRNSKFTQEIRLSMPIGQKLDWLLGGFYTHENTPFAAYIDAADPTGAIVGNTLTSLSPETYSEYAVFTDLTFHVTDQFDVQVGGRQSHISQVFSGVSSGPLIALVNGGNPVSYAETVGATSNPFAYLLTPQFKITPDLMVYSRIASGYRAGGPNNSIPGTGAPPDYQPDKTKDYEVGIKGDALDHAFSYDASLYYIDWKDIQLQLLKTAIVNGIAVSTTYVGNAAGAKSEGAELSLGWKPMQGLRLAGWVAWNEAALTENFPLAALAAGSFGAAGNALPFAARWSGNVSADGDFPVAGEVTGFAGVTSSYVGGRYDVFTATPVRQYHPPYAVTNLRAGAKYESWTASLYVNNVADRRGQISGGLGNFQPSEIYFIQPRTVGLSVSRAF